MLIYERISVIVTFELNTLLLQLYSSSPSNSRHNGTKPKCMCTKSSAMLACFPSVDPNFLGKCYGLQDSHIFNGDPGLSTGSWSVCCQSEKADNINISSQEHIHKKDSYSQTTLRNFYFPSQLMCTCLIVKRSQSTRKELKPGIKPTCYKTRRWQEGIAVKFTSSILECNNNNKAVDFVVAWMYFWLF